MNRSVRLASVGFVLVLLVAAAATAQTPSIATVSPDTGGTGLPITLAGSDFGATQGSSTIAMGGAAMTVLSWTDTSIETVVPSLATGTSQIVVTVSGNASNGKNFSVNNPDCPAAITVSYGGLKLAEGVHVVFPVDLKPCETATWTLDAEGPNWGAIPTVQTFNAADALLTNNFTIAYQGGASVSGPSTAPPYRGTRGSGARISTIHVFSQSSHLVSWSLTVYRSPRAGYNVGGTAFANAPTVSLGTQVKGSLSWNFGLVGESGQYYKIYLASGQRVALTGVIEGHPVNGSFMQVDIHDANENALANLGSKDAYGTNQPFPSGTPSYKNTGSGAYFYLRFFCTSNMTYDFQITILDITHRLTLFLDVNDDFDPDEPESDDVGYLPVVSTNPATAPRLIAAYVNDENQIVAPPDGEASFDLPLVTAFAGVAMNTEDSRDGPTPTTSSPDYVLNASTANFSSNLAITRLLVWDYGGFAKVTVTHAGNTASLTLPDEASALLNVDGTWKSAAGVDNEQTSGNSNNGDGVTAFEEWRGFVLGGQHVRTSASAKDYFVHSELNEQAGYTGALGVTVQLLDLSEMTLQRDINSYFGNSGFGGAMPNHYAQKAMWVRDGGYNTTNTYGRTAFSVSNPVPGPPSTVVAPTLIYLDVVQENSPSSATIGQPDTVDSEKISQGIAHELGHSAGLEDVNAQQACQVSSAIFTVMLTNYFVPQASCPWSNIPHAYIQGELNSFVLR